MPYRVDLPLSDDQTLDRVIELRALDVERLADGHLAALMPDAVTPSSLAATLGLRVERIVVSPATSRDAGSVWVLLPRPVRVGTLEIVPANEAGRPGQLRMVDATAFGTGLHPTTALCLEAIQTIVAQERPMAILDVGTGSGILALAALLLGVPDAHGLDVDEEAVRVAADNARLNGLAGRLRLSHGGPETVDGTWPLIVANVLAAPLIEMAPLLVRRLARRGLLVLSGIPVSVEGDVDRAYRRLGMLRRGSASREGWVAIEMQASW